MLYLGNFFKKNLYLATLYYVLEYEVGTKWMLLANTSTLTKYSFTKWETN